MGIKELTRNVVDLVSKNSPSILTGAAVAGLITTTVLAVKATPKALSLMDAEAEKKIGDSGDGTLGMGEVIRTTWKCYIPALGVGAASIVCIIGANAISNRRTAALASVYSITETAFKEYQSKVAETIGKGKEQKVRDEIDADTIKKNPPSSSEIILTGKGELLCYDAFSGRYFKSDIEQIRRIVNELNRDLLSEMYLNLNDLYFAIGLSNIKLGEVVGWDLDKGLIEATFSTQLTENGEPCLVLHLNAEPRSY